MTSKVWDVMNDLEMMTSKILSAREIIDTAVEAIQNNDYDKAETLAMAAYEFLGYYLNEFDVKFKLAWDETVVKSNKKEEDPCMTPWGHSDLEYISKYKEPLSCDKDDTSPECQKSWNDFWEEHYYPEDAISRNDSDRLMYESGWIYESPDRGKTITKRKIGSTEKIVVKEDKVVKWVLPVEKYPGEDEYIVAFPDDLLEAANLKEGDTVEWVDKNDGSYVLRKVTKPLGMDEC